MNGLGIAYVMKEAVKKQLENGDLYEVELPIELPELSINLVYMKDMLTQVGQGLFIATRAYQIKMRGQTHTFQLARSECL